MYDSTCKFIAANFSRDLAIWLLGKPIELTELKPSELSLEPIRADSLIFLESEDLVLHIEFQTNPDKDIPFRMLDYRVRVYRHYEQKEMYQVVIYLRKSNSELVKKEVFELTRTKHQFQVIRLWELATEPLLQVPGLLPFATLSQTENPEKVLAEVVRRIETIENQEDKSNLAASTAILAGLILDKKTIQRLLREDIMKESVIYQEIKSEGREEGREEGRQEGEANLIIRLLKRRFGKVEASLEKQIRQLSIEQLDNLGEALLDFEGKVDLRHWLEQVNFLGH